MYMTQETLFVSGIGTGVGKTICSAILALHFEAEYWKPVQAGDLHYSDSICVSTLGADKIHTHPERYRLQKAASPHNAAASEEICIKLSDFTMPASRKKLLIEGAGGLWVPLSDDHFMIDLIQLCNAPVALVARDYLGCINHTLLSIETLKQRNIPLDYMIFNGNFDPDTFRVLYKHLPRSTHAIHIPELEEISPKTIAAAAQQIKFF